MTSKRSYLERYEEPTCEVLDPISSGGCRCRPGVAEMRIEGNIGTYAKGGRRCRERIGFPVSIKRREAISSSSAERCWTPPWLFKRSDRFLLLSLSRAVSRPFPFNSCVSPFLPFFSSYPPLGARFLSGCRCMKPPPVTVCLESTYTPYIRVDSLSLSDTVTVLRLSIFDSLAYTHGPHALQSRNYVFMRLLLCQCFRTFKKSCVCVCVYKWMFYYNEAADFSVDCIANLPTVYDLMYSIM